MVVAFTTVTPVAPTTAVAAIGDVRAELLEFQRRFGREHGAVLDGRDIGTIIAPDARAKLWIDADAAIRARRAGLVKSLASAPDRLSTVS